MVGSGPAAGRDTLTIAPLTFTPLEIMLRCSAAGLDFRIIPAGFNPLRQRLRGECPAQFRVATTGISNGVYSCVILLKLLGKRNILFVEKEGRLAVILRKES